MIDISGLQLSLDAGSPENENLALCEIARQIGVKADAIRGAQLLKRSVDARKRANVHFIATYRLDLGPDAEDSLLQRAKRKDKKLKGLQVNLAKPYEPLFVPRLSKPALPPVVVGAGPAGLFCAWYLAKCGLCPIVVEQGAPVERRATDIERFFATGELDPHSNIQFGEGGAGTFSDGKLTTNTKNRFTAHVLQWFVDAGAPESILWQAHPHLGSDNLPGIVKAIREDIVRCGGEVRFHHKLVGMEFSDGALKAMKLEDVRTGTVREHPCEALILACGHSARETFELMRDLGFSLEQKPFSMGVRIEHPQKLINEAQWGSAASHPALGAAEYKLAIHLPSGRSVYTFCMCPGGEVVAAASEEGGVVTNGMSAYARAGKNANAALLVNVDPADFGSDDVLAGIDLQRRVEQRAFRVAKACGGAPYQAPVQRVGEFLEPAGARVREEYAGSFIDFESTYERGVVEASFDKVFPRFITDALREALPLMGKKIEGFDDPRALMTAPETRSSSPVRIRRDGQLQAYFERESDLSRAKTEPRPSGLYPCGEGPGFAGGIMSAAVDGLKVAHEVAARHRSQEVVFALSEGKPALFPTDTVYGLGIAVEHASTPHELYALKERSPEKPIAWLVSSVEELDRLGRDVPVWARDLAKQQWPGALTLIVHASDEVPRAYRSAEGTIALRVPDHEATLALIEQLGPLATTSANLSGEPAPRTFAEVPSALKDVVASIEVEGQRASGQASTVIDCTGEEPRIVRA